MVDTIVSKVLDQLYSITEEEVRLLVGVEEEVEKMTSNLQAIQAVLEDAERRQVKEAAVKLWLDKLKDIAYDIGDVLDEWSTADMKMQIKVAENATKPKSKVCCFIPSCFSGGQVDLQNALQVAAQIPLRHVVAVKITELNETLDAIFIEKDRYNLTSISSAKEPERQMYASVIDVSTVHGRDQDKNKIVAMLLSESSQAPNPRIISIVGMGGIGKTTLAQLVYNDDSVKAHFQNRIWVCVSDPFDEIRIAKAILEALLKEDAPKFMELDSLLQCMRDSIKSMRFLLVLDDVWTENSMKFEQLKNSLNCGSPGSRILVTTRKETVAKIIGTTDIDMFRLGLLSNEECWSLLSKVAVFGRSSEECEDLEDIGRGIAGKCKGLPLVAKVLGGVLCFKKTRREWQSVLDSEIGKLEQTEKGLFPILLLSYYDLSSMERRCFSYCAIFPKDHMIEKDRLIKLWMAQDYLRTTRGIDMEVVGEECFKNLAMRSFFQDFGKFFNKNNYKGVLTCKMHDIVHDFAQFLTENECFLMKVNNYESSSLDFSHVKARHSMMTLSSGVSIPPSIQIVKKLRSLIVENKSFLVISAVPSEVFDQLTCLRTLDLSVEFDSANSLSKLPKEIGKLIHLRYLNLAENTRLKELPETVCELCNLQTLNVFRCIGLEKLPHGLGKLINLRHLEISNSYLSFMPKGVERLTSLRTLDTFYISSGINDSEACTLEGLKNLNNLRGNLKICWLGNVRDVDDVKKAQLKDKEHLISLELLFSTEKADKRMVNDEHVIEAIQPPPNLEHLSLRYYRGTSTRMFPNWMMSLTNLKELRFEKCYISPPEHFSPKNEGPSKKHKANTSSSSVPAFPKLEDLTFVDMYNWEEWDYGMTRMMGEEQKDVTTATTIIIMPRLRSLTIKDCPKLKALPDHLHHSTWLKQLLVEGCPILEERYYKERKGEDWPKISRIPNIIIDRKHVQIDGHLV